MFLQETYVLMDTVKYDNCTSTDHNDNFWASATSINRGDTYSTIGSTSTVSIYSSITGNINIELDIKTSITDNAIILRIQNSSTVLYDIRRSAISLTDEWKHIKLSIVDNKLSVDGTSISDIDVTDFNRFYIRCAENKIIDFKNIRVYSA